MFDWLRAHAWELGTFSVVTLVGCAILLPVLVARMPADYFTRRKAPPESWRSRHPVWRWSIVLGKNLLGAGLLLAGVAMLVLPGQGVLTMLIGLTLLDFPGKRRLELGLARLGPVRRAIDWMRRRAHRPRLRFPGEDA